MCIFYRALKLQTRHSRGAIIERLCHRYYLNHCSCASNCVYSMRPSLRSQCRKSAAIQRSPAANVEGKKSHHSFVFIHVLIPFLRLKLRWSLPCQTMFPNSTYIGAASSCDRVFPCTNCVKKGCGVRSWSDLATMYLNSLSYKYVRMVTIVPNDSLLLNNRVVIGSLTTGKGNRFVYLRVTSLDLLMSATDSCWPTLKNFMRRLKLCLIVCGN
jgi:hypothetical protein